MNKLLVISNTAFSIEKFREHYLSKMDNYSFKIFTPSKKASLKKKYKNIEVDKFDSTNLYDDFKKIYFILKKNNHSKIIVYSYKYQFIVSVLKNIFEFNCEIISLIAGRGSLQLGNFFEKSLFNFITKIIINSSDTTICINPEDKKFFSKFLKKNDKIFLLPTEGLEKVKYKKSNNKKKNFLFFGRLIKEKGIEDYISAAKIIKQKYPHKNFYIAGPIDQKVIGQSKFNKETINLINKNKKYVKYLGYLKNYKKIFHNVDCLISPSFSEGAGTSVMEAMMSGLYVIAYNNSGHRYVLGKKSKGLCKKNNVQELVKKIEKYLSYKNENINYINKNLYKKVSKNFSSEVISSNFKKILDFKYKIRNRDINVIWPFFKDSKFLNSSINYLNNQTIKPKKLIFLDDGNKIKKLKKNIRKKLDKKIKLVFIKNKKNEGALRSVQTGLKNINSKYLYIQSSDDIIYNNFFEENLRIIGKYPKAAYVFSNIKINNIINKKKYFIKFNFLKKKFISSSEVGRIYNNFQFKIYHNTVVLNSKKFIKSNLFKKKYGKRADMLNLQYLSMKHGFCYSNKTLSEFTIRKGQLSETNKLNDDYLLNELKILKKFQKKFFNFFVKNNLHYEISIFSLFKIINKFGNIISLKFLLRSIKFKIWKFLRFYLNPYFLNLLFRIFN